MTKANKLACLVVFCFFFTVVGSQYCKAVAHTHFITPTDPVFTLPKRTTNTQCVLLTKGNMLNVRKIIFCLSKLTVSVLRAVSSQSILHISSMISFFDHIFGVFLFVYFIDICSHLHHHPGGFYFILPNGEM